MARNVLLDPKLIPHVKFSNFQAEENFFIFIIFFGCVDEKRAAAPPPPPPPPPPADWSILLKFSQNIS